MSDLVHDVDAVLEVSIQCAVEVDRVFGLLFVQEKAGIIEVLCPMRPQLVKYCGPRILLLSELGQLQPRRPEKRHLVQRLDEYLFRFFFAILLLEYHTQQIQVDRIELLSVSHLLELRLDILHLLILACDSRAAALGRRCDLISALEALLFTLLLANQVGCIMFEK